MRRRSISRERWSVLEPLLDAALELEPAKRAAFVDSACQRDLVLRAELNALIVACERGDAMLSAPAAVALAPLLAEPTPPLPALLGDRYYIVREIGRGGMATVYLADDPKHGRQVAVKVLHHEIARVIGRERFLREIEIAASLSHPHILPLHDSGEAQAEEHADVSFLYFVSPFVAGESLRDRLHREPQVATEEAVRLGREIALALDYAHRQGVIHLDIKPENILLQDGHAVIADFGIARAMSSAGDDAMAGQMPLLGTPSYMSPEQASGAPDVDGRSDIFSLGCVLYEMITGERPFAHRTATGASARAHSPPPDPTKLNERVSVALAAVVMKAMAAARGDRFATMEAMAHALNESTHVKEEVVGGRRKRVVVAGGLAIAVAASLLAFWTTRSDSVLDANLIAVAPFDVASPSLALWKEGMVDVMSRNLDGAGPFRTVPPTVVVRRWRGRADAPSARALGASTGARLVLFGGLLAAGDSVRASVELLDATTGRTLAEIERRDVPDRIDRLSDSLTVAVLRELGQSRRIDLARATSSPTTSIAALKAYLQGEQFYRAALWDSAQAHFERALRLDSGFALAYHRLAAVRNWRDPKDIPDSIADELMRQTSRFPRGLAPRERLLATVDSLSAEAHFALRRGMATANYVDNEALVRRLYATLIDGLRQYPNDPELAFLLADAKWRYDGDVVVGELDDRAILALYDRAIALDSAFAPAYVTPISLAAYLDGATSARRYISAYHAFEPSGARPNAIRLADILLNPARASSLDVEHLVDSLPADGLCEAFTLLRHIPDSAEVTVRMARLLANRTTQSLPVKPGTTCAFSESVNGLQFRGHLRDAKQVASAQAHWLLPSVAYNMARVGMVPAETTRAEFQHILARAPRVKMTKLYGWWATDGDTSSIQTYITQFADRENHMGTPSAEAMLRASVSAGRAYLALAKRDTVSALRQFLTTADTLHECWYDNRMATVQLLIAKGRYADAGVRLERRWPGTSACSNGFDDVIWTMQRARVFEKLGRGQEAAANYAFVADAWRTADPELQTYVRESHEALARLNRR
jgi:eukaryotic-like serine/threonine-protein kinase